MVYFEMFANFQSRNFSSYQNQLITLDTKKKFAMNLHKNKNVYIIAYYKKISGEILVKCKPFLKKFNVTFYFLMIIDPLKN